MAGASGRSPSELGGPLEHLHVSKVEEHMVAAGQDREIFVRELGDERLPIGQAEPYLRRRTQVVDPFHHSSVGVSVRDGWIDDADVQRADIRVCGDAFVQMVSSWEAVIAED
jgi:hypothetical protein